MREHDLMLEALPLLLFAGLLVVAAGSDIATMTIPNWVSIALAALFPLAALVAGAPLGAIAMHLLFGGAVLLIGVGLFMANILGGGDAKLIAAAAVWTGAAAFLPFAVWTAVAGGALALTLLVARRLAKPGETRPAFVNRLLTAKGGAPYGVAILTGGLMALPALPIASTSLTMP